MKKLIFLLVTLLAPTAWTRAQEMSEPMATYLEACKLMRQAIEKNDFPTLTDAKICFSQVKVADMPASDYIPEGTEVSDLPIYGLGLNFTLQGADELIKNIPTNEDNVSLANLLYNKNVEDFAYLMRDVSVDYDLNLINRSLRAGSSVTFELTGMGQCEAMIYAMSDADLEFAVIVNGEEIALSHPKDDECAAYCSWTLPDDPTLYRIKVVNNNQDKGVPFVIAVN